MHFQYWKGPNCNLWKICHSTNFQSLYLHSFTHWMIVYTHASSTCCTIQSITSPRSKYLGTSLRLTGIWRSGTANNSGSLWWQIGCCGLLLSPLLLASVHAKPMNGANNFRTLSTLSDVVQVAPEVVVFPLPLRPQWGDEIPPRWGIANSSAISLNLIRPGSVQAPNHFHAFCDVTKRWQ